MANSTAQFNGEVGNIESNINKTDIFDSDLGETALKQKYPSMKCIKDLINILIPVGITLIFYTAEADPNEIYGGTWERTAKGKAIVGVDEDDKDFATAGLTLGEKKHRLTNDEAPAHTHGLLMAYASTNAPAYKECTGFANSDTPQGTYADPVQSSGGNQPHNNIQPSMTFYIWTRVA